MSKEEYVKIPKKLFEAITTETAYFVARYGYKCPSAFDDIEGCTYLFYEAINELRSNRDMFLKGE